VVVQIREVDIENYDEESPVKCESEAEQQDHYDKESVQLTFDLIKRALSAPEEPEEPAEQLDVSREDYSLA